MTAACSQFEIHPESPVEMTLSGPLRYTYLKFNSDDTQAINALAKKIGSEHETGPAGNNFMFYSATFLPGQTKVVDNSRNATPEEKEVFGDILEVAAASIATQMKLPVNASDVTKIVFEKAVDFTKAQQQCRLCVELSQSAADRLAIDRDSRFRQYKTYF